MTLGMVGGVGKLHVSQNIGIPGGSEFAPGTSIERLVPAGSPYMVSMRGFFSYKVCMITFRFTPVSGQNYVRSVNLPMARLRGTKCPALSKQPSVAGASVEGRPNCSFQRTRYARR